MREDAIAYLVTANADHIVRLHSDAAFSRAYGDADRVTVDGRPVAWALRLLGKPVPAVIAGADLVPAILERATEVTTLKLFLFGAASGVGLRAASMIEAKYPNVRIVGTLSPEPGFEYDAAESKRHCEIISNADPDILILGLGTPKQEKWINQYRHIIRGGIALCAGATIDFLAGEASRAPMWMRNVGLEWFYRLCREPRRLLPRYSRDLVMFPFLVIREFIAERDSD